MRDIVIVGGTGFVGRHLVGRFLHQNDIRMRVLVHMHDLDGCSDKENITFINGDLLRPQTLETLCVENATVINVAYLRGKARQDNVTATNNLLDACAKAKIRRLIHCSTASVFGRGTGTIVTENTACNPVNEYENTKLQIEEDIFERAKKTFETVIVRPTAVFGPGGKNLLKLADDLRSGNKIANYLKSCLCALRTMNLVSVHNVVAVIEWLAHTDKKVNREVFIVSDDDSPFNNYSYVEQYLIKELCLDNYPVPVIRFPVFVLAFLLKSFGKSNFNPVCKYSSQKLRDFGFREDVFFDEGLADFIAWYKRQPP
jgi:nucleoside-diphosphate-sugar epimerase